MSVNRYEASRKFDGQKYETFRGPKINKKSNDLYMFSREGDRLDLIANEFYKDPRLWWIIAEANNLGKGSFAVQPGIQLRIPREGQNLFEDLENAVNER